MCDDSSLTKTSRLHFCRLKAKNYDPFPKTICRKLRMFSHFSVSLGFFQAAVIRSAAACRAPRRSCCRKVGAWWETPRETPAATRATRTWRTVMMAFLSPDHRGPKLPSIFFFFGDFFCGSPHLSLSLSLLLESLRPSHSSGTASLFCHISPFKPQPYVVPETDPLITSFFINYAFTPLFFF